MIDFHCHILPGLDDGSPSMEESLAMARLLAEAGYTDVFATPHVLDKDGMRHGPQRIVPAVESLNNAIQNHNIDLTVHPGAEYHYDRPFPDLVKKYFPLSTAAASLYVLVELPMISWPEYLIYSVLPRSNEDPELHRAIAFSRPVLAHPERNEGVLKDYRVLREIREQGYLFQVNLESILGKGGSRAQKVVQKMARERMVDFVGTDGHRASSLDKILPKFRKYVDKVLGPERAEIALQENPRRVLNNESIDLERY